MRHRLLSRDDRRPLDFAAQRGRALDRAGGRGRQHRRARHRQRGEEWKHERGDAGPHGLVVAGAIGAG
jgi:hypothetical protein